MKAEVSDEARGLELATALDEAMTERIVTTERHDTLEGRIDFRFEQMDARFKQQAAEINARFAQTEANAEPCAHRHSNMMLAALAIAVAVIGILLVVL